MSSISKPADNWHASLQLDYQRRGERTVLAHRQHSGPLMVQRPFYPEPEVCHSYIIHPPGGVVGGDRLDIGIHVGSNAHALLTTPASGKFYNSERIEASLHQHLQVEDDAVMEWLPQDNILYEGSHTRITTQVELAVSAKFIGWEITCLARPYSKTHFHTGHSRQRLEIRRDNKPLIIDQMTLAAEQPVLTEHWGLGSYPVIGTLVATPASTSLLYKLNQQLQDIPDQPFSVTLMNTVLVCRYLGHHAEQARQHFEKLWRIIRPQMLQKEACIPRIWST